VQPFFHREGILNIQRHSKFLTSLVTSLILFSLVISPALAAAGDTTRVSVASDGTQGSGGDSIRNSISADGRYVAFSSDASNLVSGDTNGTSDVFVHDRQSGQTTRVSVASDGTQGNSLSGSPSISADGRYVAFLSGASNLVSGDVNGYWDDVFVHDRQTGQTTLVSVASDGTQESLFSDQPSISADGRYVAFESLASNLVSGDTNSEWDVFVHDRQSGQTTRVSVASDGTQGNSGSFSPSISADGRYVEFLTDASNLVSGDTNGYTDVFVHDRQSGQTTRVSVASDGTQGAGSSFYAAISADGRYVAFDSDANNLVSGGTSQWEGIFIHDQQTGITTCVSIASDGTQGDSLSSKPSISADGRYVAFLSQASNLVSGDTGGYGHDDVFVHDRQSGETTRVSIASDGTQGNYPHWNTNPSISADGRYVAFSSDASNLVSGDTNGVYDVFVHENGALPAVASISGRVADGSSNGIAGVSISDGAGHTASTDSSGNYTLSGLAAGTYTITPSKSGYTFSPPSQTLTLSTDTSGVNFSATPIDINPPANITDLTTFLGAVNGSDVNVLLKWTAPGNDNNSGTALQYDIRYSNVPLTDSSWNNGIKVVNIPMPIAAGSSQTVFVNSLATNQRWYFSIKTVDAAGNWSGLSNIPSIQDSGFRPKPSGYNFPNYVDSPATDFTIEDMRTMLGDDVVCQTVKDGNCTLKDKAKTWQTLVLDKMKGGHCDGMSTTSLLFFKGLGDGLGIFDSKANNTYDLNIANIRRHIAYYWTLLNSESVKKVFNLAFEKTPDQALADLQTGLDGISSPTNLVIYNKNRSGNYPCTLGIFNCNAKGHTITPYALQEMGDGIWHVWVYDNNNPAYLNDYVEINVIAKTWKYDEKGWSGDANSHTIAAVPVKAYLDSAIGNCPWCTEGNLPSQIWTSNDISLLVTDESGQHIGNDGTNSFQEIPGAYLFIPPGGLDAPIAPVYYLPVTHQYSIQVTGKDPSTMNGLSSQTSVTSSITQFSDDQAVTIDNIASQDQIKVAKNEIAYTAAAQNSEGIQLSTDDLAGIYQFSFDQMQVGSSNSVNIKFDNAKNQVIFKNTGSPTGTYSLTISKTTDAGTNSFNNNQIQVQQNDTQYIKLDTWNNNGITIEVDKNSDGTIDQTIIYGNHNQSIGVYLPLVIH
jgi:Tol biopolymer transport system component